MRGLVRKELRDQRPFIWLVAFLLLMEVLDWLTQQFDMQPLGSWFQSLDENIGIPLFLLAFALGTGLLIRELDDRTLGFLDGLPVSRLRVFGVKTAVAGTVLLTYPAGFLLLAIVRHLGSRDSLDYALHPLLLWQSFAMVCAVTGVGLALGMVFGYLRNLCWLGAALCAIGLHLLTLAWPALDVLNPLALFDAPLVGVHWRIPLLSLAVQAALLCASLLLALVIFLTADGGQGRKLQLQLGRPLVSAALVLATIGTCLAAVALFAQSDEQADHRNTSTFAGVPGTEFTPSPAGTATTDYYSFSYPAQRAEQLQTLLRDADRTYTAVAEILGAAPGARIDVDLSGSIENTEGIAFHDRIRMRLGDISRATLAHETAHVLALRLAGGERERELSKMSALNEGLAEWIENQVTRGGDLPEMTRFQATIVAQRHLARPEQLTDIGAFAMVSDRNLQYPLGAVLVDCMVARYGSAALNKLLRVLGDADFPRDLRGQELWYAAFQAAGMDLALVFDDYARRVKSWEPEFAVRIAGLPRPRGSLVLDNKFMGIELRFEGQLPTGWRAVVRSRPAADSSLEQYATQGVNEDLIAWIPQSAVTGGQVCFQPGVGTREIIIYESWVCLPIDAAVSLRE